MGVCLWKYEELWLINFVCLQWKKIWLLNLQVTTPIEFIDFLQFIVEWKATIFRSQLYSFPKPILSMWYISRYIILPRNNRLKIKHNLCSAKISYLLTYLRKSPTSGSTKEIINRSMSTLRCDFVLSSARCTPISIGEPTVRDMDMEARMEDPFALLAQNSELVHK